VALLVVGSKPDVQAFLGALQGARASKGVHHQPTIHRGCEGLRHPCATLVVLFDASATGGPNDRVRSWHEPVSQLRTEAGRRDYFVEDEETGPMASGVASDALSDAL
jgi:hypothetical protein